MPFEQSILLLFCLLVLLPLIAAHKPVPACESSLLPESFLLSAPRLLERSEKQQQIVPMLFVQAILLLLCLLVLLPLPAVRRPVHTCDSSLLPEDSLLPALRLLERSKKQLEIELTPFYQSILLLFCLLVLLPLIAAHKPVPACESSLLPESFLLSAPRLLERSEKQQQIVPMLF